MTPGQSGGGNPPGHCHGVFCMGVEGVTPPVANGMAQLSVGGAGRVVSGSDREHAVERWIGPLGVGVLGPSLERA